MDTYGYIYNNSFNSSFPDQNVLASDDNSGNGGYGRDKNQFKFIIILERMKTYILVTTTRYQSIIGSFSITVAGPASVNLSRTYIQSKNSIYQSASETKQYN